MHLLVTGRVVRALRVARFARRNTIQSRRPQSTVTAVDASQDAEQAQSADYPRAQLDGKTNSSSLSHSQRGQPSADRAQCQRAQHSPQLASKDASKIHDYLRTLPERNKIIKRNGHSGINISSRSHVFDSTSNLSPSILGLIGRQLYNDPNHPIGITRKLIESTFAAPSFLNLTAADPVVSKYSNFDVLGFPKDHPGRSRTDTYYVNAGNVLRTHTSAHQHDAFASLGRVANRNYDGYTICADVFRRDSIDRSHFPVFHQMEGARLWQCKDWENVQSRYKNVMGRHTQIHQDIKSLPRSGIEAEDPNPSFHIPRNPPQGRHDPQEVRLIAVHLKISLEILVSRVFNAAKQVGVARVDDEPLKVRWIEAYFPFTSPSWELEIWWQGEWLEVLGCGIVQQDILINAGIPDRVGWAWGLGIERLAMLLFGIPDIRLFWSQDPRFLNQFQDGRIKRYEVFSKYPACYKDVAFWIDASSPRSASATPVASSRGGAAGAAGGDVSKASPADQMSEAFHENDVMEIVRDEAGSLAEDVKLVDEFVHPRTGRKSLCYRINYRSLERTLTNEEVNTLHAEVVARLAAELNIELR